MKDAALDHPGHSHILGFMSSISQHHFQIIGCVSVIRKSDDVDTWFYHVIM